MSRDPGVVLDALDAIQMWVEADSGRRGSVPPSVWEQLAEACQRKNGGARLTLDRGIRALDESSTAAALLSVSQPQMPSTQQQRLYLRDIVPVVPTSTLVTPFVRELNPQSSELAASGVAEGAVKPDVQSAFNFEDASVTAEVLAANITVTSQLWKDSPAFAAYVAGSRLPYLLRVREERACLAGNGEVVNAQIVGLTHDPAVSPTTAAASLVATVAKLSAAVADNGAIADFAFVNAGDWFRALETAYGSGLSVQVLEELPTVLPTNGLPSGSVVVGDFGNGAVIVDREQTAVEVYDQHADYRRLNLELVQAEERVGWRTLLPWAFTYCSGGSF